ncbi:hydratase [Anaerosphaera multitolerans]|uniref:Hydratase n=1 Tax=Anaerosphaera multitolerans TaxID=2487351 RepID=A0A437S6Q4_9FIRM|nr:hydratase [Anaerosphaera multitolerans]RVU54709.1 hydratase [Anaerosphaera multitolerans]
MKVFDHGVCWENGDLKKTSDTDTIKSGRKKTMSYKILNNHNKSKDETHLKLKFDYLTSHDITYVNIIQTARASGLKRFSIPYVLTNCHNSLNATGGTINEDDHVFALSAAKKYGGICVPAHQAVIHQYMREEMAGGGKMILGSDSHTRYGALGTMAIGEGGGELVKQLLGYTYDIDYPEVVAVVLRGKPKDFVGPMDVALTIIKEVFENKFVKNSIMEFIGDGIDNLSVEFRNGIDVMSTETTCLSTIWQTDDKVKKYLEDHGRKDDYLYMEPEEKAYYDRALEINLDEIKPMIAVPFHPSNVYSIEEFKENTEDIIQLIEKNAKEIYSSSNLEINLKKSINERGQLEVDQAVVAGCAGGSFENIAAVRDILNGKFVGSKGLTMSVYPASQPIYLDLVNKGIVSDLMKSGVTMRSAFCGPCFGAGDVPQNGGFSIRHTTRNFPNREGSKPSEGQLSYVALMDSKSIAATVVNEGVLSSAESLDFSFEEREHIYDNSSYKARVFNGFGKEDPSSELILGPNIKDWPEFQPLKRDLLVKIASFITDDVTTTDELIPSGETSSYRSNPFKLAEFTLSRKDPGYVERAKKIAETLNNKESQDFIELLEKLDFFEKNVSIKYDIDFKSLTYGSGIYANRPGDGSAREQAASSQRVLGGVANFALDYATKRYRSNLINWGIIPFIVKEIPEMNIGDYVYVPDILKAIKNNKKSIEAYIISNKVKRIILGVGNLTEVEKEILKKGSLINYYNDN